MEEVLVKLRDSWLVECVSLYLDSVTVYVNSFDDLLQFRGPSLAIPVTFTGS